MSFNTTQPSYQNFREILKQHTNQVIVWAGAGLSQPILPSWGQLRNNLLIAARNKAAALNEDASKKVEALVQLAESETNLWKAFSYLKKALGETSYCSEIVRAFEPIGSAPVPKLYKQLWSLGISGFLTLNIDRFSAHAYSSQFPGKRIIREFDGIDADRHIDVLRGGSPFVANLHGSVENKKSWIFTTEEFERLATLSGYRRLIETCLTARTILFVGVSADDQGATRHLERMRTEGLKMDAHFWLSHRNDHDTNEWAEEVGIRQILYSAHGSDHSELDGFIEDLKSFIPSEPSSPPVAPTTLRARGTTLPTPEEVERMRANDIRTVLNKEATRILGSNDPDRLTKYRQFWKIYAEAIYRAWSVSIDDAKNDFFDFKLGKALAKGAFGSVYEATNPVGEAVAIKVLHGNIRENAEMLDGFRRGVAAMKILSDRGISGMVPYVAAWEIPTSTVMELIKGPNLEEAVSAGYLKDWLSLLRVSSSIASIVRAAHQLPERVLHRDLRPPNIMLKDYYTGSGILNVVILDFDLSWHRDASGLSVNLGKSSHGYVAPEQLDPERRNLTRNAMVDSFGLGMTLFFLVSERVPVVAQHRHGDWENILQKHIVERTCEVWHSLPRRFARLIFWATQDEQSHRWDMTKIEGELLQLLDCHTKPISAVPLDLLCEELCSRSRSFKKDYVWNVDTSTACVEIKSGFTVQVGPDFNSEQLNLTIEWLNTGDQIHKNVRKFVKAGTDKASAELRKGNWKIDHRHRSPDCCRIGAKVDVRSIVNVTALQRLADALSGAIEVLRLG